MDTYEHLPRERTRKTLAPPPTPVITGWQAMGGVVFAIALALLLTFVVGPFLNTLGEIAAAF